MRNLILKLLGVQEGPNLFACYVVVTGHMGSTYKERNLSRDEALDFARLHTTTTATAVAYDAHGTRITE
jgi:hypothetical protein